MKSLSHSVIRKAFPLALSITAAIPQIQAAVIVKDNNANALNASTSWVGGNAPGPGDIASWTSTVAAANSTALGADLAWDGVEITNPGGLVTIGTAAVNTLTLGASGIKFGSSATQNLLINSNLTVGAAQTWTVAGGRTLQIQTINTNTRLSGSGDLNLVNSSGSGTALFDFRPGSNGSTAFTDQFGFFNYTGNWTINSGVEVRNLRHGRNAWGTGTITLNGGTIAPHQNYNAVWLNNITLQTGSTSKVDDKNTSGTRTLKLQGVISGDGNLVFDETGGGSHGVDGGYTLTGANTMSGTVTINTGTVVRVGGVGGETADFASNVAPVGPSGTMGTASITNNGTLTLSRNNAWTFANNITSGSGLLRIGIATGSGSHVVTVSGNNQHTGGTTLQSAVTLKVGHANALGTGVFTVAGNGFFDNATGAAISISNAIALSGGSPTFNGSNDMTFNGAVTLAGANRTLTVNNSTLALNGNITGAFNLTKAGVGTLELGGNNTHNATVVNGGALVLNYGTSDTSKLTDTQALTLGPVRLTLAGGSGLHTENVSGTTINGAALITRSGANTAEISLGAITRSAGGFLDVQSANLANTTTPNVNGILQGVTLGGANLAANDGLDNIVAFTAYSNVTRLESGTKTIADGATQQIRVTDGTGSSPAAITLAAPAVTTINSLVNSSTGGASTVDIGAGNTLRLGAAGVIIAGAGTGGLSLTGGTLTAGGADNTAGDILISNSGATMNITSAITNNNTGTITLAKTGSGTVVLSGPNTYTGTTTIREGTLELSGGAAIADAGNVVLSNVAGITLKLNASETVGNLTGGGPLGGTVDIGGNTLTVGTTSGVQVLGAAITGTGGFTKGGAGELALEGTNTFSGQITITNATLAFRGINSENGKPAVQIDSTGFLALGAEFAGQTATIGALSGSGGVNPQFDAFVGTKTLEVDQSTNTVFSGVMRDTTDTTQRLLAFTKTGSGILELSGVNTSTGQTTINNGTLLDSGSLSGSSAVTVNSGTLAGDGPVGAVTLNAGGTVAPGASPAILATGNLNFNGGTLALELNGVTAGTDYDQLSATGGVAFGANTALTLSLGFDPADGVDIFTIVANDLADSVSTGGGLFSFAGNPLSEGELFTAGAQDFTISYVGGDGNDIVLAAVPEPASIAMLLGGLGFLGARRRRR